MNKLILVSLLAAILLTSVILSHETLAKSKDSKAKDAIIKAIGRSVEGKYSAIDMVNISKKNDNATITVYNKTVPVVVPPPPPNPPPNPPPTPVGNVSKVCFIGDLSGSTVPDKMKANGCDLRIGLGDLGYKSDLSWFKSLHFDRCVIGNHDATEDGSSALYKEALSYCGDHWSLKIANGHAIIIGLNTNGDSSVQLAAVKDILSSGGNVQLVIVVSHKNGHVFPNAHHPAEAKSLYSQIESIIPAGVKLWEINAHNHNSAAAPAKNWYIVGAGGKSFYSCGQDSDWTYCDNKKLQYLELTISNKDGTTAAKFAN